MKCTIDVFFFERPQIPRVNFRISQKHFEHNIYSHSEIPFTFHDFFFTNFIAAAVWRYTFLCMHPTCCIRFVYPDKCRQE